MALLNGRATFVRFLVDGPAPAIFGPGDAIASATDKQTYTRARVRACLFVCLWESPMPSSDASPDTLAMNVLGEKWWPELLSHPPEKWFLDAFDAWRAFFDWLPSIR